jgi:enoyl-[acyl-carrier-protein] reductase (NADH)
MISSGGLKGKQEKLFIKNYSKVVPLKRMGNLEDLLGPVIFLSTEMSRYITGQNIFVDGGFSIK